MGMDEIKMDEKEWKKFIIKKPCSTKLSK